MGKKDTPKIEVYYDEDGNPELIMSDTPIKQIMSEPIENEEEIEERTYYKEWLELRPNEFIPTVPVVIKSAIPPGSYIIRWDYNNNYPIFCKKAIKLDKLLLLPDPTLTSILEDIDYFWNNQKKFEEYEYVYKRGILLYGPPGSGKTSLIALLSDKIISRGGIVINIRDIADLQLYGEAVGRVFRNIQPETPILTVMEDIDGLVQSKESEILLLNTLDGVQQLTNVVYLACTNFPEKLEERILNRPSRFDRRYKIDLPNEEVRRFYLERKIYPDDLAKLDMDDIVKQTNGLSLAHLGEFVKSTFIFGKSIEESIANLKEMSTHISSTKFGNKPKTGF